MNPACVFTNDPNMCLVTGASAMRIMLIIVQRIAYANAEMESVNQEVMAASGQTRLVPNLAICAASCGCTRQ